MSGRMFPPLATTDPRGDGMMQTVTAPGASARTFLNRLLSVVRSRTDKIIELSRAALTVPRYGESNRLVGVD